MRARLMLLLIATASAVAATSPLDPARVAPHIYSVVLENERVRVLRKTIRNGETPPLHAHPDRVIVYLNPCAWLVRDADGGAHMESFKFGEPIWADAEVHGGETATVVEQCSVLEIELK